MCAQIQSQRADLIPIKYSDIAGWQDEDHLVAFKAFLPTARKMVSAPYKTRSLGIDSAALQRAGNVALSLSNLTAQSARAFFETEFAPYRVEVRDQESGFVTGFFEPLVKASKIRNKKYQYPLLNRPDDLVDIDDTNRPAGMDPYYRFGRIGGNGIEEYLDRPAIQSGALDGKNLELVWLEDKVDVFFIHVQGSAKLALEDGGFMRVTYAAKTGHHYSSVAKILCGQLGVKPEEMTADKLADWMRANPDKIDDLLANNRSYIFFKEVEGLDINEGPIAAAKTPLIAGRSLAVDKSIHTFGVPIWVTTNQPLPKESEPFKRLMFAHDTGSAIVGPTRGDIFTGTGAEAGDIAGKIRHAAQFTVLVPKS